MEVEVKLEEDPFYKWVFNNHWVSPFLICDYRKEPNSTENRQLKIKQYIEELTDFYECRLKLADPEKPNFRKFPRSMLSSSLYLGYVHFFLQSKLYKTRCQAHKISMERAKSLISALHLLLVSEINIFIILDTAELFRFFLNDTEKCIRLASKDSDIVNQISKEDLILDETNSQNSILNQVLAGMNPSFDRKSFIISEHPLQEKFEQLFFNENFHFKPEIDGLFSNLQNPQIFTDQRLDLLQNMLDFFNLKDSSSVSIFSFIFDRAVFSYGISLNQDFFWSKVECCFRGNANRVNINQVGASKEFLPPHDGNDSIKEIIAKSERLTNAAHELTTSAFLYSPFDILAVIHRVLGEIRTFACEVSKSDDALAFDTIFGLFIMTLISSDLPNQEQVFKFALDFTPLEGLSASLEYARATVSAALMLCNSIMEKLNTNK